jgi:hypothetical protein
MGESIETSTNSAVSECGQDVHEIKRHSSKAVMVSFVDACPSLTQIQKDKDPYWKSRWCESCIQKLQSARRAFLKEFEQRNRQE